MPASKRRLAHLKNARLVLVAHFKKQKLEQAHCFSTEQSRINDNELSTSDTSNMGDTAADIDKERTWFWNKSVNESESDSKCSGNSEEEGNLALKGSRTVQKAPSQKQPKKMKWNKKGEENLRGVYRQGLIATFYYKKKPQVNEKRRDINRTIFRYFGNVIVTGTLYPHSLSQMRFQIYHLIFSIKFP